MSYTRRNSNPALAIFTLLGWALVAVLVAMAEAWLYHYFAINYGYWHTFWAVLVVGLIVALIKLASKSE